MGNFYTNFLCLGADQSSVVAAMQDMRRRGYVGPCISDAVTVYDAASDDQDTEVIERLGTDLAKRLAAPVLAVLNHDDDHLLLWLFRDGVETSRYSSIADGFAFAGSLSRVRGGILAYPLIAAVLTWPTFLFQVLRHQLLASVLELPRCSVGFGFTYISRGDLPPGLSADDLVRV